MFRLRLLRTLDPLDLLDLLYFDRLHAHGLPQDRGISDDLTDNIDTIRRNWVWSHAHRSPAEENREDLPCTPKGNIPNSYLRRGRLAIIFHTRKFEIKLFTPRIQRCFDGQGSIDFISGLIRLQFHHELHRTDGHSYTSGVA